MASQPRAAQAQRAGGRGRQGRAPGRAEGPGCGAGGSGGTAALYRPLSAVAVPPSLTLDLWHARKPPGGWRVSNRGPVATGPLHDSEYGGEEISRTPKVFQSSLRLQLLFEQCYIVDIKHTSYSLELFSFSFRCCPVIEF